LTKCHKEVIQTVVALPRDYGDCTRSSNLINSDNLAADVVSPIKDLKLTDYEVYNILTNLDASKAMGIDGIGPRILKNCALLQTLLSSLPFVYKVLRAMYHTL